MQCFGCAPAMSAPVFMPPGMSTDISPILDLLQKPFDEGRRLVGIGTRTVDDNLNPGLHALFERDSQARVEVQRQAQHVASQAPAAVQALADGGLWGVTAGAVVGGGMMLGGGLAMGAALPIGMIAVAVAGAVGVRRYCIVDDAKARANTVLAVKRVRDAIDGESNRALVLQQVESLAGPEHNQGRDVVNQLVGFVNKKFGSRRS